MSFCTPALSKRLFLAIAALSVAGLALAGCGTPAATSSSTLADNDTNQILVDHDLDGLNAVEIIDRLDTTLVADRSPTLIASVQPDALVLTDDQGREARVPMPDDVVYISVAPFQTQTHDCYFHSLTTCLGELANKEVQATLTNETTREVLLDEALRTYDNGFVGFWVPRGLKVSLTVKLNGMSGTAALSTVNADDPTCITTLKLT